jgi:Protein of unknown function (DUF4012)
MEDNLNNSKKGKSLVFWVVFWFLAVALLLGWFLFLQMKNRDFSFLFRLVSPIVKVLPTEERTKQEILTVFDIMPEILKGDEEKTYLVLFQNNLELRPGGGFIGSFGIMKIKNGKVSFVDTHDTNVFDSGISTNIPPPYPMGELLNIKNWELRDSNWSPDFPTNAKKASEFYSLEGGKEELNGVVAISTEVLTSFLEITGPIIIEGYPGEYNSENAITKLEYQVEKGYAQQGIEKGKRKYIMKDLARELIDRAQNLNWKDKKNLLLSVEKNLNDKNIMIYFGNSDLEDKIRSLNWDGEVENFNKDYLMTVDANLGALKTDLHMKRSFEYTVDLSQEKPKANLKIHYTNTARARDWMTSDYITYLRIYMPEGSWLLEDEEDWIFGEELGKKYVGFVVKVPINQSETVEINYELPQNIQPESYDLLIQKQSGLDKLSGKVVVINKDKTTKEYEINSEEDWKLNEK